MRVVILGSNGYLGSILTANLVKNKQFKVCGIDRLAYKGQERSLQHLIGETNFEFKREDVTLWERLPQVVYEADIIFNLAALVGPICSTYPGMARKINAEFPKFLVKHLSSNQRLIQPATSSEYGVSGESYCTEESEVKPLSVYATTKSEGEIACLQHKNSVSLRLATVFGMSPRLRLDLMVQDFAYKLYYDRELCLFEGNFRRSYVGIRDVINAFNWMVDSQYTGIYNVANPHLNMTKVDLAERISRILCVENGISTVVGLTDPDRRDYYVSSNKLLNTGFLFQQSLGDGVQDLVSFFKLYPNKYDLEYMRNL